MDKTAGMVQVGLQEGKGSGPEGIVGAPQCLARVSCSIWCVGVPARLG